MTDLLHILEKTTDPRECKAAQQHLEQAAQNNLPNFLVELSRVLGDPINHEIARYQAALQVKNHLTSNHPTIKLQYQQRWLQIDEGLRTEIKQNSFNALGSETRRPSSIPQVIAAIGSAEFVISEQYPYGHWPQLIEAIVANITGASQNYERSKEASLETLGYLCCDVKPEMQEMLQKCSSQILTAICSGLVPEASPYVRLAAITAMLNSLEFVSENFKRSAERDYIMQYVCQNSVKNPNNGPPDLNIRTRAHECLVKIISLYYEDMGPYMKDIFQLTMESMGGEEDIALQAIEFWSTVCDEEMDLAIEAAEAEDQGKQVTHVSANYARGALPFLTPKLTALLTTQTDDEGTDSEEWSPAKAAGVCLMNLAVCCENDILSHVMTFIAQNIESQSWQNREAAVMAFGSILEGPSPENLKPLIDQALPLIITRMQDESVSVRDTAAWFVGRACDIVPESALNRQIFQRLLEAMVGGLQDQPRVAQNICWAFTSLSDAAYDNACVAAGDELNHNDTPNTYIMSEYYGIIVDKLLEVTVRPDGNQNNLRSAAYEAVMEMIKNSPDDCYEIVAKTVNEIMTRIEKLFVLEATLDSSLRSDFHDLQSLLCATLQSVIRKVKPEHMAELSDKCMTALLRMLTSSQGVGSVQEDALQAVGTLIEVVGMEFEKYMPHFNPILCKGLQNHEEQSVCIAAVGVVTDICRAMQQNFGKYFKEFMELMYQALSNPNVHQSVKPQIVAAMGDAALALGRDFKQYLSPVMMALKQASSFKVSSTDYEGLEYQADLREACLDALTGIIQGLKGDENDENNNDLSALKEHLEFIFAFLCDIAQDTDELNDTLLSSCVGLIGDISMGFGPIIEPRLLMVAFAKEGIQFLLTTGKKSKVDKTKRLSNWAIKHIKKIEQAANQ